PRRNTAGKSVLGLQQTIRFSVPLKGDWPEQIPGKVVFRVPFSRSDNYDNEYPRHITGYKAN
ncbi:hypothetical protein, partial [Aneurinibacillus thermoaerophilus]|uniref:hypothetical protein n=1 Tax=Aneurinibacillus thermoaerophilus TaxID=143495 RepID=UPI002E2325CC|nr:hypothetical protein [Aneurinibacillus thermoaerophilus]